VTIQPAAEQRSELSPRRAREPWVRLVRLPEPRSGDRVLVNEVRLIISRAIAPPGLDTFSWVDPRLAKPRPGLNSDRCSAAGKVHVSRAATTGHCLLPVVQQVCYDR